MYVHADGMSTFAYGLLCAGDRLSVAPQSALWLIGFHGESLYIKGLLDKIGVQGDFLHMGDYKSAAEVFTRTGPSEPAEENLNWLYDSWYDSLVGLIARSRDKTPEQVRALLDGGPYLAEQAKEKGLIDAVETRDEFLARMRQDLGASAKVDNRYGEQAGPQINFANPLAIFSVFSELFKTPEASHRDAVGLIYVTGTILPGYGQRSLFGAVEGAYGGSIRKALEKAANDASVKAVVMRIDSPGGSAEASEVILNATRLVQGKKPFIVSMGDVAASGGYYIACEADAIFADEATITASIGVVGGKLVTTGLWDMLGVNWVGHKRGANADLFSSGRPFRRRAAKGPRRLHAESVRGLQGARRRGPGFQAEDAHRRRRGRPGLHRGAGSEARARRSDRRTQGGDRLRRREGVHDRLRNPHDPRAHGHHHRAVGAIQRPGRATRRTFRSPAGSFRWRAIRRWLPLLSLLQRAEPARARAVRQGPAANRPDRPERRRHDAADRRGRSLRQQTNSRQIRRVLSSPTRLGDIDGTTRGLRAHPTCSHARRPRDPRILV